MREDPGIVAELATAKSLPEKLLRDVGLEDLPGGGIAIPYYDADGNEMFRRTRGVPGQPRFRQPAGVELQPYGLDRLAGLGSEGALHLCEGESDAWTCWHHGLDALGLPGSGGAKALSADHLAGVVELLVLPDNDVAGKQFTDGVTRRLGEVGFAGRVQVVHLPDGVKDINDLHRRPGSFRDNLDGLKRFASEASVGRANRPDRNGHAPPSGGPPSGYQFKVSDSPTFFLADYRAEWLVKRLLVSGQPAVLGGPKKTLKTSVVIDLAVSLATGAPFLGEFAVYRPRRVVLLSAESGEFALQETGKRVCAAKGVDPAGLGDMLMWGFDLPQLARPADVDALRAGLDSVGAEVVIIDPLYLCLLAGQTELSASNLYDMGPLLRSVAKACIDVGATPVFIHHSRKNLSDPFSPLDLEDLAFAGVQEFVRQWLLVSRRVPYEPGTGSHKLWMTIGGSAGQSGCWGVDVEEGQLQEDFSGRRWEVTVLKAGDVREGGEAEKVSQHRELCDRQTREDGAALIMAIDKIAAKLGQGEFVSYTRAREAARLSNPRMTRAVLHLIEDGVAEEGETVAMSGPGYSVKRATKGVRRRPIGNDRNDGTNDGTTVIPVIPAGAGMNDGTRSPIGGACPVIHSPQRKRRRKRADKNGDCPDIRKRKP